jgi:hypothetical protein
MGRKILALSYGFTDFPSPAVVEQGIQISIMFIHIANEYETSDMNGELWKRKIMKLKLHSFISSTWTQFLFFICQ